jgi:hypothetical protein
MWGNVHGRVHVMTPPAIESQCATPALASLCRAQCTEWPVAMQHGPWLMYDLFVTINLPVFGKSNPQNNQADFGLTAYSLCTACHTYWRHNPQHCQADLPACSCMLPSPCSTALATHKCFAAHPARPQRLLLSTVPIYHSVSHSQSSQLVYTTLCFASVINRSTECSLCSPRAQNAAEAARSGAQCDPNQTDRNTLLLRVQQVVTQ